jgi:AbrB family looped-hinge helix DNA binding protein
MTQPKGKHLFGTVKVGEKGQIVIPRDARKIFDINPGDTLMVLGDEKKGIAILKNEIFTKIAYEALEKGKGGNSDESNRNKKTD